MQLSHPKELQAIKAVKAKVDEQLVETKLQLSETELALRQKERELVAYTAEMERKMAASLTEVSCHSQVFGSNTQTIHIHFSE